MSDDWKGEHLIRNIPRDYAETQRLNNSIYHKKRRALGVPAAGAKKHNIFIKATFKESKDEPRE